MSDRENIGRALMVPDPAPNVVPFGKYRGQPVAVLMRDQSYLDWLAGQEGIRRQYPWLFGAAAEETPEHNRYQVLFLDDEFAHDVYEHYFPGVLERDHRRDLAGGDYVEMQGPLKTRRLPVVTFEDRIERRDGYRVVQSGSADVALSLYKRSPYGNGTGSTLRIEIKPQMGDDYPAVLRQMKVSECNMLYLVAYTGSGATLGQVRKIFSASGIAVAMHSDFWE
jgi:hypothetical protein